jgi:hypothetical protein
MDMFGCCLAEGIRYFPVIPWYVNVLIASVFLAHPFVMAIKNKRNKK